MDNRYASAGGDAPSSSMTGYNVRARAMGLASRAKSRAASAYAVASAAATAAAAGPGPSTSSSHGAAESPQAGSGSASATASLARLANGARSKAVNAFERAADAFADELERDRERRRIAHAQQAQSIEYQLQEDDDPDTPRPSVMQMRRPTPSRSSVKQDDASRSGRTSPLLLLKDPSRTAPSPVLIPVRPSTSSSDSPTTPAPLFGKVSDAARKRFAAAGSSLSSSNIFLTSSGGSGRNADPGRQQTVRTYSTGPNDSRTSLASSKGKRPYTTLAPVAPGQPLHAPGSEEAVLLPGWCVRRGPSKQGGSRSEAAGKDIHILLAGVVLRTPEAPSRSQRIFLRVAKQIAALPKINSPSSSMVWPDGTQRSRPPIVVPNFSGAPLSDEPSQVDDLSAYASQDPNISTSSIVSESSIDMGTSLRQAKTSSSSSSSAAPSNPSSPMLDPEDLASQPLTEKIIRKVVQGANDDLLLKAMEQIGALPVEERPPAPTADELQRVEGQLPEGALGQMGSPLQSPTVLGADAARSAHMAEAAAHPHTAALTDSIPPLSLDPSVTVKASDSSASTSSPSKLRKIFGTGLGDSPSLRATTAPPTPGAGSSGSTTPNFSFPRSESSSRLTRFAESVKRRASMAPESMSSSVSSLSSSGGGVSPRSTALGPFSTLPVSLPLSATSNSTPGPPLTWPSGSGVWADRSFEQLLTLQQNLDSRLRAFWTFRLPDREVWIELVPVFRGEEEGDVQVGPAPSPSEQEPSSLSSSISSLTDLGTDPDARSSRKTIYRPLLAATKCKSNMTGQFNEKFVVPWEKLDAYCRHFYSGQNGMEARRPEDIVCLKKRCVLIDPGASPEQSRANPGRWIPTDVDDDADGSKLSDGGPMVRVISDVDDTVKKSHVTEGVRKIFHSVFVKPFEEVQIPGVSQWYCTLREQAGVGFHFVSNTPLELHGLVCGFLESAGFPRAHLHLKHYPTGTRNLFTSWLEPAGERKKGAVLSILDEFPHSKFILIGDSGELDMELYTAIAAERRAQILGIFIRNVSSSMKPDAALQVGNAAVASAGSGGGSVDLGSGGPRKPLFKRNATLATVPTFENGQAVHLDNEGLRDDFTTGPYSSSSSSSTSSFSAFGGGAAANASSTALSSADESRRKREAAFALRVQRARATLPPEIPMLFYTEGDEATTAIALDLIERARAKA
ncbi:hypothetical protein OC842_000344 [Tilletia horrida]|uniref:Phosphatidate phosphatase APP1 catalytic domain-containing protein n=1 Tax=Tilletia horrida TaxID=155126 RepID=A0AAN6GK05_9BASI|nr:hypothetical protein OC842_000344 [Tilletia horrida]